MVRESAYRCDQLEFVRLLIAGAVEILNEPQQDRSARITEELDNYYKLATRKPKVELGLFALLDQENIDAYGLYYTRYVGILDHHLNQCDRSSVTYRAVKQHGADLLAAGETPTRRLSTFLSEILEERRVSPTIKEANERTSIRDLLLFQIIKTLQVEYRLPLRSEAASKQSIVGLIKEVVAADKREFRPFYLSDRQMYLIYRKVQKSSPDLSIDISFDPAGDWPVPPNP